MVLIVRDFEKEMKICKPGQKMELRMLMGKEIILKLETILILLLDLIQIQMLLQIRREVLSVECFPCIKFPRLSRFIAWRKDNKRYCLVCLVFVDDLKGIKDV